MGAVAGLLICAGIIGLIVGIIYRVRAGRVLDAPLATTGDIVARGPAVAGPKGQVSAQGQVMLQQPLISPMQGIQCLYYELKVTASWKEGDTTKTKDIEHTKMAAQFAINDGSGPVWVDLREGGDFEPLQTREQSQETGLLKGIVGGQMMFGNYALNTGILSMGTKYTVEEKALPVQPSIYVCGKIADQGGMIVAPKWRNMLVSEKTRDQYLAAATKTAKIALIGGGAGLGLGIIFAIIAAVTGPSKEEIAAAEAAASASAAAAQSAAAAAAASASATATDEPAEAPSGTATAAAPVKAGTPTKATTATTAKSAAPTTTAVPAPTGKKPTIVLKPKH